MCGIVPADSLRGEQMSNRYVNLVLGVQSFGSASRRQVMHVLADHADAEGRCFPSIPLLQKETELSKRTVVRCLSDLEGPGWLDVGRNSVGPKRRGNEYLLNRRKLEESQRPPKGAIVAPLGNSEEDSAAHRTNGATMTPLEQTMDGNGATMTRAMVPLCPSNGAKSASLYRRTPINPQRNPQGESEDRNTTPPSKHSRGNSFNKSQIDYAKELFDRIGCVAPQSTLDLAAGVIAILARESSIPLHSGMLALEAIARDAQGRGEVINNHWFGDGKWRPSAVRNRQTNTASSSRAMVGMYTPELADALERSREGAKAS